MNKGWSRTKKNCRSKWSMASIDRITISITNSENIEGYLRFAPSWTLLKCEYLWSPWLVHSSMSCLCRSSIWETRCTILRVVGHLWTSSYAMWISSLAINFHLLQRLTPLVTLMLSIFSVLLNDVLVEMISQHWRNVIASQASLTILFPNLVLKAIRKSPNQRDENIRFSPSFTKWSTARLRRRTATSRSWSCEDLLSLRHDRWFLPCVEWKMKFRMMLDVLFFICFVFLVECHHSPESITSRMTTLFQTWRKKRYARHKKKRNETTINRAGHGG